MWGSLRLTPNMCCPSVRISLSSISMICNISINDLQLMCMCDDTQRQLNVTVQKMFYSVQCKRSFTVWINMESPTARKRRLQHRRERQRAHWVAETAAEKEERLRRCRKRDQERRAAEKEEQSVARLRRRGSRRSEGFSAETEKQREVRLMRLSDNQRQRLARESQDECEARLERMSINDRVSVQRINYISELLRYSSSNCDHHR